MRKKLVMSGLVVGLGGLAFPRSSDAQASRWSATQTSAALRDSVTGSSGYVKAQSSSVIVEIRGVFSAATPESASIRLPEITLRISFTDNAGLSASRDTELFGVGLVAPSGSCAYEFPHELVRRVTRRLEDPEGNGFEIRKGDEADPATLRTLKNPVRLCLAFGAPSRAIRALSLRLGASRVTITPPSER